MMLEIIYLYGYQDYNGKRVLSSVAWERDVTVAPLYVESKVTENLWNNLQISED